MRCRMFAGRRVGLAGLAGVVVIGLVAAMEIAPGAENSVDFAVGGPPRLDSTSKTDDDLGSGELGRAELSSGQDSREAVEHAAALAAEGRTAEARQQLAAVSKSDDPELAALAHYNLGCLAATEAKELLGPTPEQLPATEREKALALLAQACEHFRQCLARDPRHADARHNLELVRLWIGAHRDLWQAAAQKPAGTAASPKPAAAPAGTTPPKPPASQGNQEASKPESRPPGSPGQAAQSPQAKATADKGPPGHAQPADPLRQYAEDLMAKVRQRIQDRRQREQSRLLPRWNQPEEKDW